MKWIPTTDGGVSDAFVIRFVRDADGIVLHMTDGSTVRSTAMFDVVDGELVVVDPVDDDDDDCPF